MDDPRDNNPDKTSARPDGGGSGTSPEDPAAHPEPPTHRRRVATSGDGVPRRGGPLESRTPAPMFRPLERQVGGVLTEVGQRTPPPESTTWFGVNYATGRPATGEVPALGAATRQSGPPPVPPSVPVPVRLPTGPDPRFEQEPRSFPHGSTPPAFETVPEQSRRTQLTVWRAATVALAVLLAAMLLSFLLN